MKTKFLDDKLQLVVKGDEFDIKDCAKMILLITNGGIIGYRNENLLETLLTGKPLSVGDHKREKVKVCDGKIMYGFVFCGASSEAEKAARNHYDVIKENIQKMTGANGYRIIRKYR
jgi:hypothetical protein